MRLWTSFSFGTPLGQALGCCRMRLFAISATLITISLFPLIPTGECVCFLCYRMCEPVWLCWCHKRDEWKHSSRRVPPFRSAAKTSIHRLLLLTCCSVSGCLCCWLICTVFFKKKMQQASTGFSFILDKQQFLSNLNTIDTDIKYHIWRSNF